MTDKVLYEQDGPIVTLTLNDPAMRNPISEKAMVDGIVDALDRLNQDGSVRVAILTGAGSAFSSGGDLRKMKQAAEERAVKPALTPRYYKFGIQRIPLMFEKLDVPIIAAVNGPAIGAGLDLACMCDIRIAGQSAKFAESFVKVGIVPGDGGAFLLPRAVGYAKACEMAFTGDMLDAQEALACGLVSRVVPDAELLDAAKGLAQRIAANPPHAVRMAKRLLIEGRHARLDTVLELSASLQALTHATADHREAVDAFLEKRKPAFKGD
ncbi:MAG TPA: crotonase/enoyl-CoA hydratase family protein [Rhodopila sp.]|uniref:crotonase/enoyl-CoA hydratase family protein n=1 Tax=Rhodopila sp. TaxID=2480087 RepID=UPI002C86D0A5|nr:crotonase/enoyl-CoA hydratase family protein [Rhodopila sp.]HVY18214.1 crotonase/enoyl-CoA hydratase family protein [Rhodopila sp.]